MTCFFDDHDDAVLERVHTEQNTAENMKNADLLLKEVAADFENFKKRIEKERVLWSHVAYAQILKDLLPIVDNFDRALTEHAKKEPASAADSWIEGFALIHKSLYKFLQSYDVTPIEQVKTFDPALHEAVAHIESAGHQSGEIVDVLQNGFRIKDRVLRPAKVVVAK